MTFYLSALPEHQWQKFPSSTPETNETHFWFQLYFHLTCWPQAGLNGKNLIILLVFSRNFVVKTNLMPLIRDIWYCFIKVRKLSSGYPLQNGSSFSQKNLDEDAMMLWWISLKLVFSSQLATCNHWSQTMCFHFLWEILYGMVGFHFSKLFLDFFILCEKSWQNWFI